MADRSARTHRVARVDAACRKRRLRVRFAWVTALAASLMLFGCGDALCDGSQGKTSINARVGRYGHLQVTLPNGNVWVLGGIERTRCGDRVRLKASTELYVPSVTGFVSSIGSDWFERAFFAGAVSDAGTPGDPSDDYVLIAGGVERLRDPARPYESLRDSVIRVALDAPGYNPGTIERVGNLPGPRMDHVAVALPDGRVAFLGGRDQNNNVKDSVQIWSADGRSIELETADFVGTMHERYNHRAVFVPNQRSGWILVTGGRRSSKVQDVASAIDLDDNTIYDLAGLIGRQYHSLTLLDNQTPNDPTDDAIVEVGGLSDIEENIVLYQEAHQDDAAVFRLIDNGVGQPPAIQLLALSVPIGDPVFFHTATADATGTRVIVTGGFGSLFYDGAGVFTGDFIDSDPVRDAWRLIWDGQNNTLSVQRFGLQQERAMHAASRLNDGNVLVTGGINGDLNGVRGAELITP